MKETAREIAADGPYSKENPETGSGVLFRTAAAQLDLLSPRPEGTSRKLSSPGLSTRE